MKNIEIDEELYQHIASNTQFIGESASSILRRLLNLTLAENQFDEIVVKLLVRLSFLNEKNNISLLS